MEPLCRRFSTATFDENGELTDISLHYEDNYNFAFDVVDAIAAEEPDKRALVWCNEAGQEGVLTFGDIRRLSNQAANYLTAQGIRRGDRVLLLLGRHFEYWYLMMALHKIGALAIPGVHMLKPHDIAYRLDAAEVHAVICTEDPDLCQRVLSAVSESKAEPLLFNVRAPHEGFVQLDEKLPAQSDAFERPETHADDPLLMYFTSGTTGNPKMVMHTHTYSLAHIVTAGYWQCVQNDGLHLTVADTGWAKASWGKLYGQWLCGSAVLAYEFSRFDGERMMDVIEKYGVTTFCAPPTLYRLMAKSGLRREAFSSIQHASTAGEALQEEIIRLFYEKTGLEIMEGYGQTETVLIIGNYAGGHPKRGSMGKPNPLYKLRLVNPQGEDLPAGETGEIVIDTRERMPEGLCQRYEKNEHANARYWKDGVFHTGDTAYRDEDGYYYYVGRLDDVIKSSGYRIGPFEVESVLIGHPSVLECAITGVPDPERGQLVKATVVLRPGCEGSPALADELKAFVKERTAPYKYPRIIEFVEELPKTVSGKICYNVIRERDAKKAKA
ncbi:MAG: AMP-binding protein [Oscillospiraceae bacterium]|nr:AMP-binding protein [Oscillospiraceae bacterium]